MRRRIVIAAATLAWLVPAMPTPAQGPPELKFATDEAYRHRPSGLMVPATLDGLPRKSGRAFAAEQLDESIAFGTPGDTEALTIYVFRHVTGSVPVWFDRAVWSAEHRTTYGGLIANGPARPFTPPNQRNAAGLIASYRTGKDPYRSTAVALLPLGPNWYVALRYSSETLDPATLDARLQAVVASLGWPSEIAAQPDASPIATCATPLALSGAAKAINKDKNSGASALMSALLASAADDPKAKPSDAAPTIWCRDPAHYAGLENAGVYRPIGTNNQYLLALADAGRGAYSGPDAIAALLDKTSRPSWSISFTDVATTASYAPRDRLPPPDQLAQIVMHEPYRSRATTWGDKRNVDINSGATK